MSPRHPNAQKAQSQAVISISTAFLAMAPVLGLGTRLLKPKHTGWETWQYQGTDLEGIITSDDAFQHSVKH
jgi:hypothetical protein